MDLRSLINQGEFYSLPFPDLLHLIHKEYPTELERLKTAYSVPAYATPPNSTPCPSQILYHADYDEINRTLTGISMLRKIHHNDYTGFAGNQPASQRLQEPSFAWIRSIFTRGLKTPSDLYTLVTSMIINDLGKSPSLAQDLQTATATTTDYANHDLLLHQVVCQAPHLIPCLDRVPESHKANLLRGIELGGTFNFGQMAQAECPPASLVGLERIQSDNIQAFEVRYMEQILDIAGALGHQDHSYAARFSEPIYRSYRIIYEIATEVIKRRMGRREGYDANLVRKLELLVKSGWGRGKDLDVGGLEDRALMRLLCICNASTVEVGDLVWETFFEEIGDETREALVDGLNVNGSVGEPAVQATYSPAVCSAAIKASRTGGHHGQKKALAAVFRYLARVLTLGETDLVSLPDGVTVAERDIRERALAVINSAAFAENPDVLDAVDVPEAVVAVQE